MKSIIKPLKITAVVLAVCVLCFLTLILAFKFSMEKWTDYEYYTTLSTSDGRYDVVLDISYPPIPPNARVKMKMSCRDNISEKNAVYTEFSFSVPDKDIDYFELEEISSEKVNFIANTSHGKEIFELIWNVIFKS